MSEVLAQQLEMQRKLAATSFEAWQNAIAERKAKIGDLAAKIKAATGACHAIIRDDEDAAKHGSDPAKKLKEAAKLLRRVDKLEKQKASEAKRLDGIIAERMQAMRDAILSDQLPLLLGDSVLVSNLTHKGHILRIGMVVAANGKELPICGFKTKDDVEHVLLMRDNGKRLTVHPDDITGIVSGVDEKDGGQATSEALDVLDGIHVGDVVRSALLGNIGTVTELSAGSRKVTVLFADEDEVRHVATRDVKLVDTEPRDVRENKLSLGDTVKVENDGEYCGSTGVIEAWEHKGPGRLVPTHARVRIGDELVSVTFGHLIRTAKRTSRKKKAKRSKSK